MDDNKLNDDFSKYIDYKNIKDSLSRLLKAAFFTTISKSSMLNMKY
ncbi:2088_t:CDS:2 [Funneliformis mosseae]|uniref:2088_t:CDS:1 n=1 Tax=Funneliformis mosseae TaxID=27381 RepID=A0A9N8YUL5_FUNMO|nr:2088_t:CDS:2 [Funneliformis mosseae]